MRVLWPFLVALLVAPTVLVAQSSRPKVRVVAVTDGPSPAFDVVLNQLATEIETQLSDRYEVELAPTLHGDWSGKGVRRQLDAAFSEPEVVAVFGLGHLVVTEVASRKRLPKPTILPFVTEASRQGLPRKDDVSGRRNLSYISEKFDISDESDRLRDVAGSKNIVFLAEESEAQILPEITEGQIRMVVADPDVAALLNAIPNTADGVVISPMPRLGTEQRKRLTDGLIQRRLPNIAVGPSWVDQGAMMSIRSPNNVRRRVQRAALNLDLILEGRPSSEIHVDFEDRHELIINMATATAIGVRPTFEVLLEADLVDEAESEEGRIKMSTAMRDSIDANLDLLVSEKFVEAGEEGVKRDRGPLLPQGALNAGVVQQDPDRIFPGGQVAERQASWTARASQVIYSETAWTRYKSRRLRQSGREYGYFTDVLDIMLEAGAAYVGVLRAGAQERIQRKNIQLTREYLELARLRLEVGVANASELYRWQVTLAENQRSVVDARALVSQSKIALNRVLNRPSEQPITPIDLPRNADGRTEPPDDPIGKYMNDPFSFKVLRAFMVREGLRNSPEARQIEKRREAQERIKAGRSRELWLPEFFVEGGVQNDFWRDGEGTDLTSGLTGLIPEPDKFGWDVGLFLAIPLSRGGSKVAEMRQAGILIERLTGEFARIEQDIDTGVRTELYNAGAALASVGLTRNAAVAAASNLLLVTDLYRRGKVDIITLTDAQTQNLVADLAAANAVYDYVLALLFVSREAGHFRNLDTPEAKQDFSRRLNEFVLTAQSVSPAAVGAP
ncbi:MAG: TolC family protein [Myxococcales bacterium]|nr:TolC family protein [Myxococcales bacterium]MDH3843590.1 TolC family protein [Myxococcales bacterium]